MLKKDKTPKDSDLGDPVESLELKESFFERRWVKATFGGGFAFLVLVLLAVYWFLPFSPVNFYVQSPENSNFSLNSSIPLNMQFYPNMRYPSENISYSINSQLCTLQKQANIKEAMATLENLTVLNFYPVNSNPEISVTCDSKVVVNEKYFVAGEGGPVNITKSGNFNVIKEGKILLLRESSCPTPNVAIHELLHALGFDHSQNPNNVMYPVTSCAQTIGKDIPSLIDEIYSYPPYPDLALQNASAILHGRYIDANITVENTGLADSNGSTLEISVDGKQIKKVNIGPIDIGSGIIFHFANLLTPISVNQIDFSVNSSSEELQKNNNKIELVLQR